MKPSTVYLRRGESLIVYVILGIPLFTVYVINHSIIYMYLWSTVPAQHILVAL